ncbi:hypothetical protein D9M73_192400 [compost metagenome]
MFGAGGTDTLFHAPDGPATFAERGGLVLLAVGGGAGAIEYPVTGGLQQDDAVVLAELGQTLHTAFLGRQADSTDVLGLEPVEVVSEVDHGIRPGVIEKLGQAGGVPALLGRTRSEKTYVFLGALVNQRLSERIAAAQQHQAHSHREKGRLKPVRGSWRENCPPDKSRILRVSPAHVTSRVAVTPHPGGRDGHGWHGKGTNR